jgi:hypothetical protein
MKAIDPQRCQDLGTLNHLLLAQSKASAWRIMLFFTIYIFNNTKIICVNAQFGSKATRKYILIVEKVSPL